MREHLSPLFTTVAVCLCAGLARGADMTGREIMAKQQKQHDVGNETTQTSMKLFDSKNREKHREMITFSVKPDDGNNKTLMKFLSPPDIHNVGLLTWEQPQSEEDDQWLYLPAARQVKRIAGGSKKNLFMGTDMAYEDMRAENLKTHTYKVVREEPVDGQACWVIEALPSTDKEKADSGYTRRLLWVRQDIFFTVKTEFYGRGDRLVKRGGFHDLVLAKDPAWRSDRIVYERVLARTRTEITCTSRTLGAEIQENLFTEQGLRRPPFIP